MVQPVETFNQEKIVNCSTIMATGDNKRPTSAKKLALRELPNETTNTVLKTPVSDTVKFLGFKRPICPANENSRHLVYVRRKYESSPGKGTNNINYCKNEPEFQSPPSYSITMPVNGLAVSPSNYSEVPSAVHDHPETPAIPVGTREIWKERFFQLQMFLKSCDESNQEEYIQKLRSSSAAERSRHAYELEARAIQLALDEGKELQRMKILKIMGNATPVRNTSIIQNHSSPTVAREEQQAS